jgi:23S rRNA (adenine2503-C2)-methyltransferase
MVAIAPTTTESPQARNLLGMTRSELETFFIEMGEKRFRAQQLMQWMYQRRVTDFSEMHNIGKGLQVHLTETAEVGLPEILTAQHSSDGTRKWLLALPGGNAVETVYIPEEKRGTLCVSSQIGCGLNCTFCSTGTQGFNRNLTAAEIIGQVWVAARELNHSSDDRRITNVVMMGMGEPLLNFEPVVAAMELMRDDFAFGLAARRVTLSTAGLVPKIRDLRERADVALAISLHAPNDALRNELVPLNKKYNIDTLLTACRDYVHGRKGMRITIEYTLIDGMNDKPEHARGLVKVLSKLPCKINLIPFNPFPGSDFRRSQEGAINKFRDILLKAGFVATVRKTRGDDIDAACGQLVGKVNDRTRRQATYRKKLRNLNHPAVAQPSTG